MTWRLAIPISRFAVFSLMALLGTLVQAQLLVVQPGQKKLEPAATPQPAHDEPRQMLVSPAAEPVPALSIRFWLDAEQRRPGNAMAHVQRALLMEAENPQRAERNREYVERIEAWGNQDLSQIPREEVRAYLASYANVLDELYKLPYPEMSDYGLSFDGMTGAKIFTVVMPEIQAMRQLARLLQLDIRLALAEGRQDDALRSIQAGIRLGEIAGSATPTLVGKLVGIAISSIMLEEVRLAITLPDTPNYYWALATLPDSSWDMREVITFEVSAVSRVLESLQNLPDDPVEPSGWRKRLTGAVREFTQLASEASSTPTPDDSDQDRSLRLGAGLVMLSIDGVARDYLQQHGMDPTGMTPSEAVLRATSHSLIRFRDEQLKWVLLPESLGKIVIPETDFGMDPFEYRERERHPFPTAVALNHLLYPAINAARAAGTRGRQTVAVLATVEALRMHAARHGQFPETLDQLDPVPAWPDPVADGPFQYERKSSTEAVVKRSDNLPGWSPPDFILRLRNE